ncbi:MAG TPA: ABC transporter substrate-binding protein [Candidatus Acidoferrales bacterium]|nr:ABC transporter substrate-binding protein [Candidatus Acidoferrales bacterium]
MATKRPIPRQRLRALLALAAILAAAAPLLSLPDKKYDPGVSDTEIKIGNIMTYTGWASQYGAIGRAEAAYLQMINDRGGVSGRKIDFISLDSASDSATALVLAHKLVEEEHALLIFGSLGTDTNLAIRPYLNDQRVPQLFIDTSSSAFNDPAHFPWTMGFDASFRSEGAAYAKYILQIKPDAKIAILYANDDSGRDYLAGAHEGLVSKASAMIVKELSYSPSDPTIDAQVQALRESGADVFLNFAIGPFATQAIRKAYDLDWHPMQFIPNASLSVAAFLEPAGLEKSAGVVTNARSKGWLRDFEQADPEVRDFVSWMHQYNPQASLRDQNNVAGYERAEALVELLKKCGNDLTRPSVMRQASHLDLTVPMLRAGIKFRTTPTDFQPIHQFFLMQFDGARWRSFGGIVSD